MSNRSPESDPLPKEPHLTSVDNVMSRRRFLGKAGMAIGGTTAIVGAGTAIWEGRKIHLPEDYQHASTDEEQAMRAFDRRQWKRFFAGAGVLGYGMLYSIGGAIIYQAGRDRSHSPGSDQDTDTTITPASHHSYF